MKYSTSNLKKLEQLIERLGYVLRYEKGHFQSGYCWVRDRDVLVINKFYTAEARWQLLQDLLFQLPIAAREAELEEEERNFLAQVLAIQKKKN